MQTAHSCDCETGAAPLCAVQLRLRSQRLHSTRGPDGANASGVANTELSTPRRPAGSEPLNHPYALADGGPSEQRTIDLPKFAPPIMPTNAEGARSSPSVTVVCVCSSPEAVSLRPRAQPQPIGTQSADITRDTEEESHCTTKLAMIDTHAPTR